jgi:hypothetical protein
MKSRESSLIGEDSDYQDNEDEENIDGEMSDIVKNQKHIMNDSEANEIFYRLFAESTSKYQSSIYIINPRRHMTKKNWSKEESKLLDWALHTY